MAVHAHPDDEAIGTGGILAKYAAEGVRTVLVTCTNGELGDSPEGVKPDMDEHEAAAVAVHRLDELRTACAALGVAHLELLGYHDSGMKGWPQNDMPGSFWQTPLDEAVDRIVTLMEKYRPQVVVTYDENGFYGHPDHIQANRATLGALERTDIPAKLYYNAVPRSALVDFRERLEALGVEAPVLEEAAEELAEEEGDPPFGTPDELITTVVDVSGFIGQKRRAMLAHASQMENSFFLKIPEPVFDAIFSTEAFVRHHDTTGAAVPEDDLFAGLR
jgi:LmbE family N-acetylglucosaminyl deacetylase